jgi:hypothetical protein
MNPGSGISVIATVSSGSAVATGFGVSSTADGTGGVATNGVTTPGVPGGLMMIWTQPLTRMQLHNRTATQSPVIFITSLFSFTVFEGWLFLSSSE